MSTISVQPFLRWRLNSFNIGLSLMVGAFLLYALILLNHDLPFADEEFHMDQIDRFVRGEWTMNPGITTIPLYHLLMAFAARALNRDSLSALRIIGFGFSAVALLLFFLCSRQIDGSSAALRTLQWTLLPILFPFFFLLYTDVAALAFVLASLLFFLRRQDRLSGLIGILSIATRQQNILWYVFLPALRITTTMLCLAEKHAHKTKTWIRLWSISWRETLRDMWVFLFGSVCFILFAIWNHGIAIGDAFLHPFPFFSLGNAYFFLFSFFVLFLPLHLLVWQRLRSLLTVKRAVLLFLGFLGFFFLYWVTFTNSHPYNQTRYSWWLRNRILIFALETATHKALFFLPIVGGLLSLSCLPLLRRSYALLYPFMLLYLGPSWLIEQRYYLVPLTLFMLFRRQGNRFIEYSLLAYWFLLSAVLLSGIHGGKYFL